MVMEDSLTREARRAVKWAVQHALPGTPWRWKAESAREDVYFRVVGYVVLADPDVGCVLALGLFRVQAEQGNLWKVQADKLPAWYLERMPQPGLLSALDLKALVDKGEITSCVRKG